MPLSMAVQLASRRYYRAETAIADKCVDLVFEAKEVVQIFSPVVAEGRKK